MSWLSDFMQGGKSPSDAANKYISQIPGATGQYMNPYIQQGQGAYNAMNPIFMQMLQDPSGYMNNMMKNYAPSESYKTHRDEATRAASNSAAAGGMLGSSQDVNGQSKIVDSLLSDDMQQWFNNVMGINQAGMQGENNFYNTGANASNNMANTMAQSLAQQGNLAYAGQNQKNAAQSDMFKSIMGMIGGAAGLGMPGGGTVGGSIASKWL